MRSILLFFALYFLVPDLLAQPPIPVKQIDSIFKKARISDDDWAISLSIEQAGIIRTYDSLGNMIDDGDPMGTFLLLKIGGNYFLQKLCFDYSNYKNGPVLIIGDRQKLNRELNLTYSVDSIESAEREWIYPFIYKDDSLNTYSVQSPADHEPYYGMYFKTVKHNGYVRHFTETDLTEVLRFIDLKNLNYAYNTRTFTYRVFSKLHDLIKTHIKPTQAFNCF